MDPLSAVLVSITLATALKDIIETAKAIQDAFSKLPNNFRNARNLAEEVLTTLEDMREIYDDNTAVFNRSKHLQKALNTLRMQMKTVYDRCLQLIPPVHQRKRHKFFVAFYIFRNRETMERLISDLKSHVDRCSQQFLVLSNLRTETLVVEMHDTLHSSTKGVPNGRLVEFMNPIPSPMTRIADAISIHDLSTAYLRREVGVIARNLQSLLVHWAQKAPVRFEVPPFTNSWFLGRRPIPDTTVHQQTVILAFNIQSLLSSSPSNSWINIVDNSINNLSLKLRDLRMVEDAIAVGALRVRLWREMVTRYPGSTTSSYRLAEALTKLSILSNTLEDRRQTYTRNEEAMDIIKSLSDEKIDNIELFARNMIIASATEQDPGRALELATAAHRILRSGYGTVVLNDFPPRPLPSLLHVADVSLPNELSTWSANGDKNADENLSHDNQFTLATCLLDIAQVWQNHHKQMESHSLMKVVIKILIRLHDIYPGSEKILEELMRAYTHFLTPSMQKLNSVAENLEYAEDNSTIIRYLAQSNPQRYVLDLLNALWIQRDILLSNGRLAEAQKVYQDMGSLKDLAAAPAHADLEIPSEIEGDYYLQVARLHLMAQHPSNAIYAAQNAVSQFSALEFMNPGRSLVKHISALALLCQALIADEQYDAALQEGFKALKIIDNSISLRGSNFALIQSYEELLGGMMDTIVASKSSNSATELWQAKVIAAHFRSLSRFMKVKSWKIFDTPTKYAEVLERNTLVEEAISHLQDVHEHWEEIYGDPDNTIAATRYVQSSRKLQTVLKDVGEIESALRYNEEVFLFAQKFQSRLNPGENTWNTLFTSALLNTFSMRASLLSNAGRYADALDLTRAMLSVARKSKLDREDEASKVLIQALFHHSITQLYNHLPLDSIVTATETVSLCARLPTNNPSSSMNYLYISLTALCNGLSDVGRVDEALLCLEEAEKAAQRKNGVRSIEELEKSGDGSYEVILTQRFKLLFAKGHHSEAADLIKEAEILLKVSSKTNKSALQNLAKLLQYSGIVYCTIGRHEEGIAAVTELKELKKNLAMSSPGLAQTTQVSLDFMMKRGSWKSVEDAKRRLECNHHE